jgi:hypothetical protein
VPSVLVELPRLANDGLEFIRLQEEDARAAQEWFANGVRLLQLQQRNAEFVQGWMGDAVETVREQTEHNVRTAEAFARSGGKQQEGFRALTQQWTGAYRDFFPPSPTPGRVSRSSSGPPSRDCKLPSRSHVRGCG